MKTIPLTRGLVALVDDADFEALSRFRWSAAPRKRRVYAARHDNTKAGRPTVLMHSQILPCAATVDHRDGDGLNNQRANLRPATIQENLRGRCRKREGTSSKFRGVSWRPDKGKWAVAICSNGVPRHLGYFSDERDAAKTYNDHAKILFGDFASLNEL
jgi:hypothetical protein